MKTGLSKKKKHSWCHQWEAICTLGTHPSRLSDSEFWGALGLMGFPGGSGGKESACSAGDLGLIPESGR